MKKQAPKYAKPKSVVKSGFRRVSKAELKALGYSERSALYTKAGVAHPTKFITRADILSLEKPIEGRPATYKYKSNLNRYKLVKREKILAAKSALFRYTYNLYWDDRNPISLTRAIDVIKDFFEFLQDKHNPRNKTAKRSGGDQIGVKDIDNFSIMPVLWRNRETIIDRLITFQIKYKKKYDIRMLFGWIEQES